MGKSGSVEKIGFAEKDKVKEEVEESEGGKRRKAAGTGGKVGWKEIMNKRESGMSGIRKGTSV